MEDPQVFLSPREDPFLPLVSEVKRPFGDLDPFQEVQEDHYRVVVLEDQGIQLEGVHHMNEEALEDQGVLDSLQVDPGHHLGKVVLLPYLKSLL